MTIIQLFANFSLFELSVENKHFIQQKISLQWLYLSILNNKFFIMITYQPKRLTKWFAINKGLPFIEPMPWDGIWRQVVPISECCKNGFHRSVPSFQSHICFQFRLSFMLYMLIFFLTCKAIMEFGTDWPTSETKSSVLQTVCGRVKQETEDS